MPTEETHGFCVPDTGGGDIQIQRLVPVIVVAAPHLSVLAVKVITADRFASRKVICSRVLSLGAALAYLSIADSSLMSCPDVMRTKT